MKMTEKENIQEMLQKIENGITAFKAFFESRVEEISQADIQGLKTVLEGIQGGILELQERAESVSKEEKTVYSDAEKRRMAGYLRHYKEIGKAVQEVNQTPNEKADTEFVSMSEKTEETEQNVSKKEVSDKNENPENTKKALSYYVTVIREEHGANQSQTEHFDDFAEAMVEFQKRCGEAAQPHKEKRAATFGIKIRESEIDVVYAENKDKILLPDFMKHREAVENGHFMSKLQTMCDVLVDKVRVQREMTPEEEKAFVKKQMENRLLHSGITDISIYMSRFDAMYEQGKMEYLMPEGSEKQIVEEISFAEWENPYMNLYNRYADFADKKLSVAEYEMLLGMEPVQPSVNGLAEFLTKEGEMWYYPPEEKEDCLLENIPVVMVYDGMEEGYFEIPKELIEQVRTTEFWGSEPEHMAFAVADKFISIQLCEEGYDYSVFGADYTLIDGGVYDSQESMIYEALRDIFEEVGVSEREAVPIAYDELMEKTEAVEQERIEKTKQEKQIISDFKAKTNEMFHEIGGLNAEDVEITAMAHILSKIDEYAFAVEIVDLAVSGSRCRGLEQEDSDIDVVVEYKGNEQEDVLFQAFHDEEEFTIGGVKVDINLITAGKTGTLAEYLPKVENYLEEKRVAIENAEKVARKEKTAVLAADLDAFIFSCNPKQYGELVKDKEIYVAKLQRSIESGRTQHISKFLNGIITEGIREGVSDIFGGGIEADESMAVQWARMAKALIDRLEEYKPPTKEMAASDVENSDNKTTSHQTEKRAKEHPKERISIKEKLAEKKAVIEKQDKPQQGSMEKGMEKKVRREM